MRQSQEMKKQSSQENLSISIILAGAIFIVTAMNPASSNDILINLFCMPAVTLLIKAYFDIFTPVVEASRYRYDPIPKKASHDR